MDEKKLRNLYTKMQYNSKITDAAVKSIRELEKYLHQEKKMFETVTVEDIKKYIIKLLENKQNSIERILAIARYFYLLNRKEIYVYFASTLGGLGVIDNIKKRTVKFAGKEKMKNIFKDLPEPPIGTPLEELPAFTQKIIQRFKNNLPEKKYQKILAGNNHGMPKTPLLKEKKVYEKLASLDEYLKNRHKKQVEILQKHCDENKIWFEQIITQKVVDFVKENQEILSAVRKGNKLYVTKIPFNPDKFLTETNPKIKRYFACHCPFAREAILQKNVKIHHDWCYCSAGYEKFPFEVILNQELDVKVLESVLKGDNRCRFVITIKNKKL
ncbi:MAG: DUF6144 family protein [bacterium]|nr:DUF6144 family protein [bacterium]